jgi:hypothetical protein
LGKVFFFLLQRKSRAAFWDYSTFPLSEIIHMLNILWDKNNLTPQTTSHSPDSPSNYHGLDSSLLNYQKL